ncbi:MAG: hypothetical protein DRI34_12140, partial [Deltaproteobacteria bacterium]
MTGRKTLFLYLAVLLLSAVAAVVVFNLPEKKSTRGLVLLDEKPSELTELVYSTSSKEVRVTPRQGGGFTLTVRQTIKPPKPLRPTTKTKKLSSPAADGGTDTGSTNPQQPAAAGQAGTAGKKPATAPVKVRVDSYRASKEFSRELERLLPLTVERELGQVDEKHLAQFGLTDSDRRLSLSFGERRVEFVVGGQTYGGATLYLQRHPQGAVYLVSTPLQRTLDIRSTRSL